MSHQERASIVAIITNLLVNGYAAVRVGQLYDAGALSSEDALMVWAQAVIWVIPLAIGLTIVLNILFTMAEKGADKAMVVDERDRQFQLRGIFVTLVVVGLGYITMLAGFAIGWTAIIGLNLLFFTFALGDLLGNTVRLASYRISA
ncbi:MAG: hypothetical protein RIG82_08595 [Phycisphaeraceae bacterium]